MEESKRGVFLSQKILLFRGVGKMKFSLSSVQATSSRKLCETQRNNTQGGK